MVGRRLVAAVVLLAVGGLAWWILASGPDGASGPADTEVSAANEPGDRDDPRRDDDETGSGQVSRTDGSSGAQDATVATAADPRLLIPSFVGTVVDANGQPLADATVEAVAMIGWAAGWDPSGRPPYLRWETRSGADGGFRIPEAPRDGLRFLLRVHADGHAPRLLRNLPAIPGRTRALGEVALAAGARLAGRVLDPDGAPVAGAQVEVLREARMGGVETLQTPVLGAVASTDADGRYAVDGLPSDSLRVRARAEGLREGLSAAQSLAPGTSRDDVDVLLGAVRSLRGSVRDADGAAVADAALRFLGSDADPRLRGVVGEARSTPDGSFAMTLPAELSRGRLLAAAPGSFRWDQALDLEAIDTIEVLLQPLPTLSGQCTDPQGRPVPGATVRLLELRTGVSEPERLEARAEAVTGADGRFTLQPDLRTAEALRFLVHARSADGESAETAPFTLLSPERWRAPDLQLTLGEGFHVRGTVVLEDGAPADGARVLLRRLNARRASRLPVLDESRRNGMVVARASTAADGGFAFPAQPVGDYRVEAFLPDAGPGESEEFGLVQGDVRLIVPLPATAALVGQVEGPLRDLGPLQVTATQPGRAALDVAVANDGSFRIEGPWPGVWNLQLRERPDALDASTLVFGGTEPLARADGVRVVAGGETPVTLRVDLAGLGSVSGGATLDGGAAAGHRVFLLPLSAQVDDDPRIAARSVVRLLKVAPVDANGRFRIAGVAPDRYWLVLCGPAEWPEGLWDGSWEADSATPAGLARTAVVIDADAAAEASFSVVTGALRIDVGNRDRPLLPTAARLVAVQSGVRSRAFRLGPGGATVGDLPAGSYELRMASGSLRSAVPVEVPPGAVAEVEVTLAEPHMLQQTPRETLPGLEEGGGR